MHYRILEKLGEGGMGEVYLAEDTKLDRNVALKFLPKEFTKNKDARDRFKREAKAAAALNHTNIVTVYEINEHNDQTYIAMEYVDGRTLKDMISDVGARRAVPLQLDTVLNIATQIASGLAAAHGKGIVHRDIKPQNILIDKEGRVKILDFGLAKLKGVSPLTRESSTLGTVNYMSPEQARGKEVDQRTDIWSLGVVLYEILTGELPFKGDYEQAVIYAILNEEPEDLDRKCAYIPVDIKAIVRKCLEKDCEVRFQHVDDLIADLKRAKRDSKPISIPAEKKEMRNKFRKALWPILGLFILLIIIGSIVIWKPFKSKKAISEVNLLPNRYYVAILENQTNERSLDALGRMAADWITQGLSQLGRDIEPVVAQGIANSSQIQQMAEKSRAGKFIYGAYYLAGDSLQFQLRIMDTASGKLVYALPVSGLRQDPMKVVNLLSQRLTGSLAMRHEWEMDPALMIEPPLYEAYQEFMAGVDFFGSNDEVAITHFQKAVQLDPRFLRPKLYIALTYSNRGDYAEAEAVLKQILGQKKQFSLVERHTLDWYSADLQGNYLKAYRSIRLAASLAPKSWVFSYLVGLCAQYINYPQETVDTYFWYQSGTDFSQLRRAQSWWYEVLADSHHMLGNFQQELEASREGKHHFPDNFDYQIIDARALAARGEIEEARKKIEECFAFSAKPLTIARGLLEIALELRAHGHARQGSEIAQRNIAWLKEKEKEKALTDEEKFKLAQSLAAAEQWADAKKLVFSLASQDKENISYAGLLGTFYAREGNHTESRKLSEKLRACKQPYLFGEHTLWRARIAAQVGEKEEAVRLLREAFAQGNYFGVWLHRDFFLEPLHGFPSFEDFARPKTESEKTAK